MATAYTRGVTRAQIARLVVRSDTKSVAAIQRLALVIRGDIWNRWMAIAQKRALIWWRDRIVPPGLKARFTVAGAKYYGFGMRLRKPSSLMPYFRVSGALEAMLMKRRPKTPRASLNSNIVRTTLKFGGGALNFLMSTGKPDMRPVVGYSVAYVQKTETFNVSSYTRAYRTAGGIKSVTIPSYTMTRVAKRRTVTPQRAGEPHGVTFGRFTRDAPAIAARVAVEFRRIVRSSAYDKRTGDLKSSILNTGELAGAAS
jgi:hypothetical protein